MHLDRWVPERFALGAELEEESGDEEVLLDSGIVVTNQRWAEVRRVYNVALSPMEADDPDLVEMRDLWRTARRGHSFNLVDPMDETEATVVKVRFGTDFSMTAINPGLYAVNPFTLVEDKSA